MGILSTNPQAWTQACVFAQQLSPMSVIGMYKPLQDASKTPRGVAGMWFPPPASQSAEAVIYSCDGHGCAGAVSAGIWRYGAASAGNGKGSTDIADTSIDTILKGLTPEKANGIIAEIGNITPAVMAALKLDANLHEHYVPFLWLARHYTSNRKGATLDVAQALETVAAELQKHFNLALNDLRKGTMPARLTASVIIGQLPPTTFTVGKGIIDDVAQALAETAKDGDLNVSYEASIALASMAVKFWARRGMISFGITTLITTMDRLRHDAHYDDTQIATCIRLLDELIDDHGSLMPGLTPTCMEIGKSMAMLSRLQDHGSTSRVRIGARTLLKKINLFIEAIRQGE